MRGGVDGSAVQDVVVSDAVADFGGRRQLILAVRREILADRLTNSGLIGGYIRLDGTRPRLRDLLITASSGNCSTLASIAIIGMFTREWVSCAIFAASST